MNEQHSIAESEPNKQTDTPVRVPDVKLTPEAEAKAANKLSKAEQMKKFEQSLEVHDPGNQPS